MSTSNLKQASTSSKIIERCTHKNKRIQGCKDCSKIYQKRRAENKPLFLWEAAKNRAKRRNTSFTIQVQDIIIPKTCPVLGIPIDWRDRDHAASIDEIIPGLGYNLKNICVISGRANRIKSDASLLELKALVHYIEIRSSNKFGHWPD